MGAIRIVVLRRDASRNRKTAMPVVGQGLAEIAGVGLRRWFLRLWPWLLAVAHQAKSKIMPEVKLVTLAGAPTASGYPACFSAGAPASGLQVCYRQTFLISDIRAIGLPPMGRTKTPVAAPPSAGITASFWMPALGRFPVRAGDPFSIGRNSPGHTVTGSVKLDGSASPPGGGRACERLLKSTHLPSGEQSELKVSSLSLVVF